MRIVPLLLGVVALCLGLGGVLHYEMKNPGSVRAELAVVTPRIASAEAAVVTAPALDLTAARVDLAIDVLAKYVPEKSHPDALRAAFHAYYAYRAENPSQVRKPYLYFVDYGLDNRTPRGYVFDMETLSVIEGPFTVAHGRGSARTRDGIPTSFSNRPGSLSTSLGLYLAQETYQFRGTSGGRAYRSIGLRLRGLSGDFNSAARSRGVVVHGAPYVTESQAGRSEGCPAMEPSRAERLIPLISNGGMVFHFSPQDRGWMAGDPWARPGIRRLATAS